MAAICKLQEWRCCGCKREAKDTGPGGLSQRVMVLKTEWQQALISQKTQVRPKP